MLSYLSIFCYLLLIRSSSLSRLINSAYIDSPQLKNSILYIKAAVKGTSKLKTPPICTKVPPIDRARQGESNHTRQAGAKPKPATKDASKFAKTRIFATPPARSRDAAKAATRPSVQPPLGAIDQPNYKTGYQKPGQNSRKTSKKQQKVTTQKSQQKQQKHARVIYLRKALNQGYLKIQLKQQKSEHPVSNAQKQPEGLISIFISSAKQAPEGKNTPQSILFYFFLLYPVYSTSPLSQFTLQKRNLKPTFLETQG